MTKHITAAIIAILLGLFVAAWIVRLTRTVQGRRAVKQEMVSLYEVAVWELIRREGISLEAYRCPAGHRTIGIGRRDEERDTLTLDEARPGSRRIYINVTQHQAALEYMKMNTRTYRKDDGLSKAPKILLDKIEMFKGKDMPAWLHYDIEQFKRNSR